MSGIVAADAVLAAAMEISHSEGRSAAARRVATLAGADDLLVFVRDAGIGRSLPAPGFVQTLRGSRAWRTLTERAIADHRADGIVLRDDGAETSAHAVGLADGTVLVLLGGSPDRDVVALLTTLLPMFGALFRMEALARRAEAESMLARRAAAEAAELASKLDAARADLQRAVSVAETATRARDDFLATVSHELRTPLTSIIGWIQLLREEADPAFVKEGLETIDRNARAQSRLIEDILDFSRINAGKLRLDIRPMELAAVITAALEVVRPAADARGVSIDAVLDPNAGLVSGDPDRLQQVVWNLLSNAVKFTPRGGRVQARLERVNSQVEIAISDTGEGISSEFLPHVFDRFSQADSTSTRTHGGLGLGLGIVRHLVELHGGTVQAFSPGLGKGSTFAIHLPVLVAHLHETESISERAGASDRPVACEPSPLPDLKGISILVVEDNDDARRLLTAILSRSNASVRAAENVEVALRLLAAERPDIIISDIEMPREDGYSFIRKVRQDEPAGQRVPAIALTAYARGVDRVRALAAGFQMHIAKPVDPAELATAVRSLAIEYSSPH